MLMSCCTKEVSYIMLNMLKKVTDNLALSWNKRLIRTNPRMPPIRNANTLLGDTETAFRQVHASERPFACTFTKVTSLGGQKWVDAITEKEAFSQVRAYNVTSQRDFEVDRQPTCTFSTRRSFDHRGNKNDRKEFRKERRWHLFVSLINLVVIKTLFTARVPVTVSHVQTWPQACVKKFSPAGIPLPTSLHLLNALKWPWWHSDTW